MGRRCIAPNCTSGYDTNKERCHLFNVPRNSVSMWQEAIPRQNFIVKPGQVLCEKHFRKEDILWNRQHFDASGNIVGWSEYKVPRLKKGAIPTLFGGHSCLAPTISAAVNVGNIAAAHENLPCKEANEESEPAATSAEVITSPVEIIDPLELIVPPLECAFSFDALFSDDTVIDLPLSWSRRNITSPLHLQAVQFSQWTCRKEGKHIKTTCLKEIVIGKSLIVDLYAMGHSMELEKFNIPAEPLSCASDLAKIVKIMDELKVCSGSVFPSDNLDIETKSTYKDNAGQVRHKNCPLLLNVVKTCVHCERGRSTLQRKRRKLESVINIQRNRVEMSSRKNRKLEVLRRKVDNVGRSRRRALVAVNCLRASLQKCQTNISELSQKIVENQLEMHNISPNQRTAILEILAASKHGDVRGRRYSDDWMLLCMLLHMRSPNGYNFLRSSAILPLPCVRSIRRYRSTTDSPCGLDPKFFEIFRLHMESKTTRATAS